MHLAAPARANINQLRLRKTWQPERLHGLACQNKPLIAGSFTG